MRINVRRMGWALLVAAMPASQATAQSYPTKPIRLFEAGGPGGLSDIIGRGIALGVAPGLGQPVVVENRVGSNGVLGTDACAKGAPDGHVTCVLSNSYLSMNPHLYAKLPYDPARDFAPAINVGFVGGLIIANPAFPANNVKELVEMVRGKPGVINWATWGSGSFAHLTVSLLESGTKIAFNQVPYKAPAAAVTAVVSGEAQLTQNNPRVMAPLIKAGKLKPIAVVGPKRFSILPDVATFAEQGFDLDFLRGSFGVLFPAATPRSIIERWNAEVNKLMADPGFLEKYVTSLGLDPAGGTPEDYAAFLKADRLTGARVAKAAKLEPQ